MTAAQQRVPEFVAATIKRVKDPDPNCMNDREEGRRYWIHNTTVADLIIMFYSVDRPQIEGGPAWIRTEEYDLEAVAEDEAQMQRYGIEMLRNLLRDRFHLVSHRE